MSDKLTTKPGEETVVANDASSNTVLDSNLVNLESFVEELSPACINNDYVLVIGSEAVLSEEVVENGDSLVYLYKLTKEYINNNSKVTVGDSCKNFTEMAREVENVWSRVYNMTRSMDTRAFDKDKIEKTLIDLLATKCFPIVLTTTIDPFVEKAMDEVWGKNNYKVKSLWSISAQGSNNQEIGDEELKPDEFYEIKPILYYAFGNIKNYKHNKSQKEEEGKATSKKGFVLTENDAMVAVSEWFSSSKLQNFRNYIRQKQVLSIGCRFDDWLFRFFWFLLIGNVDSLDSGQVVVELNETEDKDKRLLDFLKNEEIGHFDNARIFMKYLSEAINTSLNLGKVPVKYGRGVFISYASEDFRIAWYLFTTLRNKGMNVWLDKEKIKGGDEIEDRIKAAINACKVFIPILSSQVREDLENRRNDRYYIKEWMWAQERQSDGSNKMEIFPIIVGQENERNHFFGNEHLESLLKDKGVQKVQGRDSTGELVERIRELTNKK